MSSGFHPLPRIRRSSTMAGFIVQQRVHVRQGRLNYTTLADLPEGAPDMTGTFPIHNQPAVILFDSGATHSFISISSALARSAPGRSSAATWPASGGGRAELAEPRLDALTWPTQVPPGWHIEWVPSSAEDREE
nr:unnamed protein product [Digitaria exilis]